MDIEALIQDLNIGPIRRQEIFKGLESGKWGSSESVGSTECKTGPRMNVYIYIGVRVHNLYF